MSESELLAAHALITRSYWAENIPLATFRRACENPLCFQVQADGQLVAFARVITDRATYAYLCDVMVAEAYRGRGFSKQLLCEIQAHPDLQGLRRFTLCTRDAHELYRTFGFSGIQRPEIYMEINVPNAYSAQG